MAVRPIIAAVVLHDLPELTEIAFAAKRHWGYPPEWMELWRDELTASPAQAASGWAFAARLDGVIVGWCALELTPPAAEITACWVRPSHIGRGVGSELLDHALPKAELAGIHEVTALADPNAEEFYRRRGFERIGREESSPPGRHLPLMRLVLIRRA